jgi:transcriptional regulator with XRE-family HTH domain
VSTRNSSSSELERSVLEMIRVARRLVDLKKNDPSRAGIYKVTRQRLERLDRRVYKLRTKGVRIYTMSIGSTLKLLRVASDLKQSSLAKDLDITANYLSLVENGKKEPSLTFLKKFSQRLNIPLGYFLWIALEDISLPEELELKDKMDKLLVSILQQKRKDAFTSQNEKS